MSKPVFFEPTDTAADMARKIDEAKASDVATGEALKRKKNYSAPEYKNLRAEIENLKAANDALADKWSQTQEQLIELRKQNGELASRLTELVAHLPIRSVPMHEETNPVPIDNAPARHIAEQVELPTAPFRNGEGFQPVKEKIVVAPGTGVSVFSVG